MSSQRSVSMTGFFGADPGPSPFDSLLAQCLGSALPGRRPPAVGITRLIRGKALAWVAAAVRQVAEWGNRDLDSPHRLWAATRVPGSRQLIQRAGADPDALAEWLEPAAT